MSKSKTKFCGALPRDTNRKREALCSSGSAMFRSRTILPSIEVEISARNIDFAAKYRFSIRWLANFYFMISGFLSCCFSRKDSIIKHLQKSH